MRMFEILCSGTLLVTNRLSGDDLACLGLREGEHLVSYGSPQELMARIDSYLMREEARERIASRGMAEAQRAHTYRHRLQQILQLAQDRLGLALLPNRHTATEVSTCASS